MVVMPDSLSVICTGVSLVKAMLPVPVLLISARLMEPDTELPSTLQQEHRTAVRPQLVVQQITADNKVQVILQCS